MIDFGGTGLARLATFGTSGCFEDEGVQWTRRQLSTLEGALSVEEDVAREDDASMLVDEFDGSGARYVSCGVEDYFDLFFPLSIDFTAPKTLNV